MWQNLFQRAKASWSSDDSQTLQTVTVTLEEVNHQIDLFYFDSSVSGLLGGFGSALLPSGSGGFFLIAQHSSNGKEGIEKHPVSQLSIQIPSSGKDSKLQQFVSLRTRTDHCLEPLPEAVARLVASQLLLALPDASFAVGDCVIILADNEEAGSGNLVALSLTSSNSSTIECAEIIQTSCFEASSSPLEAFGSLVKSHSATRESNFFPHSACLEYILLNESIDTAASNTVSVISHHKIAATSNMASITALPDVGTLERLEVIIKNQSCLATPNITDSSNNSVSPLSSTRMQLDWLAKLNRLRQGTSSKWPLIEMNDSIRNKGISCNVEKFLEAVKNEAANMQFSKCDQGGNDALMRINYDFTEKLWLFCLDALSQQDLLETMNAVAAELESGTLQPMLHKNNHTHLAHLVRECFQLAKISKSAAPSAIESERSALSQQFDTWLQDCMDDTNEATSENQQVTPVVQMLIDIGIDKMKRDFMNLLVSKNLLTAEQFTDFFMTDSLSESIFRLHVITRIVEPWLLAKQNIIALSFEYERKIIQSAFQYWLDRLDSIEVSEVRSPIIYRIQMTKYAGWSHEFQATLSRGFAPVNQLYTFKSALDPDSEITIVYGESVPDLISIEKVRENQVNSFDPQDIANVALDAARASAGFSRNKIAFIVDKSLVNI